jgi:hypothetical protein
MELARLAWKKEDHAANHDRPQASPRWNVDGLRVLHRQLDRSNLGVVSFLGVAETAIRQPQDAGEMSAIAAILTAFISSLVPSTPLESPATFRRCSSAEASGGVMPRQRYALDGATHTRRL